MEQSEIKYKISVVIPVYNGEKYLRECVDSILAQSFKDYEIVMVDDGSKDSSGTICDEYATKYDFIHVYHKANEGINQTRCFGVRMAQGEWIAFSDQDDSMPEYALQTLWDKHEGTDIVIGFPDNPVHKKQLSLEECRENAITAKLFPPSPWAKLYRRLLLSDDIFDFPREIDGEEDMIMNIRLMFKTNQTPHFAFKKVYNFRRNTASVSHTKKASLLHEMHFDNARAMSIPQEMIGKYMPSIIKSRLNGLTGPARSESELMCNKNHPYIKQLKEDIKKYSYKMSFQEWMLLNIPYAWLYRKFSFMVIVKNYMKYHLGLNN